MPLTVEIDTSAVLASVNDMLGKITHFKAVDMGQEMSDWQTEDMHRHRPFTMRFRRAGRVVTKIRPHSLYETMHSERYQRREARRVLRGGRRSMYAFTHWEAKTSTRPILRAELEQRLVDRMNALIREKLVWKG